MANLFQPSLARATDTGANPISGAKMYFYLTGTTTLATVYSDPGGTTPAGPGVITADSTGLFAPAYLDDNTSYRVKLTNATGSETIFDVDPVRGFGGGQDVTWFGADPTGLRDSTTAVQAAFNLGCYKFPAGTFKLSGNITMPETACGTVEGIGSGATRLLFSAGGLVLPCKGTPNGSYHYKAVKGMTLATSSVGTDTGLRIYRTDTLSIDTRVLVDDVDLIGSDGIYGSGTGPAHYWGTLIDMQQVRFITLSRSQLHGGGAGKTAYGWRVRSTDSDPQFFVTWDNVNFDGCTKAMSIEGWCEGIYGSNFSIFGCRDGIYYTHTGTTVGSFSIDNCDMFASRCVISLTNINNVNIGKGANAARGFIEPGYNSAFQEGGAVGNSTIGYHYVDAVAKISSAGEEGQVTIGGKFFSVFGDTTDFVRLTDVNAFNVDATCYGAATGAGLALLGSTRGGSWNSLIVDARGSTVGYGVSIANTCTDIQGGSLVTDATARISDTGDVLGKYRTAFSAYASATLTDKTGDGTFYTPILNTVAFNAGSCFNTATGVFTAAVDGVYQFNFAVKLSGILVGHVDGSVILVTPAGNRTIECNPYAASAGSTHSLGVSATVRLTAGQTVTPQVVVAGGTKVVDLLSGLDGTTFDGALVRAL